WGEKVGGGGDRGGGGAGRKRGKERAVEKEIDKTGRAAKTRRYLLAGIRHPLEANHIGVAGRLRRVRPLAEVRVPYEGQRRVRPVFRAPRSATRARTWLPEVRVPDHADRRARLVLRDHVWPGSMRATGPPLFQAPIQASPKAIPIAPRSPSPAGAFRHAGTVTSTAPLGVGALPAVGRHRDGRRNGRPVRRHHARHIVAGAHAPGSPR